MSPAATTGTDQLANSMQEQLLALGLATEKQAKKVRHEKRGRRKKARARPAPAPVEPAGPVDGRSARRLEADRKRTQEIARDARLARTAGKRDAREQARRRLRELIGGYRQNAEGADLPLHFPRGKRIKKIHVTEEQRRRLLGGELAVIGFEGGHFIVAAKVVDELRALDAELFVHHVEPGDAAPAGEADPDYAEYQVPDDLVW